MRVLMQEESEVSVTGELADAARHRGPALCVPTPESPHAGEREQSIEIYTHYV